MNIAAGNDDEFTERGFVRHSAHLQFDVAHALAATLQQTRGIVEERAEEEAYIGMFGMGIDIGESDIAGACRWPAVVDQFAHIGPARAQPLEPGFDQAAEWIGLREPRPNVGIGSTGGGKTEERVHSLIVRAGTAFA